MSLRGRFAAASSAIAFVTLSASLSAVWFAYGAGQQRQLDMALLRQADEQAREASYSGDPGHPSLRSAEQQSGTYATVYDAQGQALVWTRNLNTARPRLERHPARGPYNLWWNNEHLRAVITPIPDSRGEVLWLAAPRTDLDGDARDLARRMAAAIVVAVVASAALAWWLARVLTRDHDRIASVARKVAAGDLAARVGRTASSDPEMVRLGRDIDEMISRLSVLLDTQQRFIANASHELRSPVTTMLGELSFALHRERDAAAYRESIEEALSSARRLKVLAEDLLALARLGSVELDTEPVLLSEVARAAVESSRAAADTAGVAIEQTLDGAAVEGHPRDLQRLLRNLIENAIRHSPPGGHVRIEAHSGADSVRVIVSDQGHGVAPDVRERIFEPFFRSPDVRADSSGAGLGLAIARAIARAHGGDLWVDPSGHGTGARFVIRLPLCGPTDRA